MADTQNADRPPEEGSLTTERGPVAERADEPEVKEIATAGAALEHRIFTIRGRRVMLDSDLAAIYQVLPKRLNQQVKRNKARFPFDFAFQLTPEETAALRLQVATSNTGRGGRRFLPYVFTEHGAVMLASVLRTPVAVQASIQVVRAFIRLRALAAVHKDLAEKLDALEAKYDEQFRVVFETIRELMSPAGKSQKSPIGFSVPEK